MAPLEQELQNANELIKKLREENDYKEAYIKALQVAQANILPFEMFNALNFIKSNQLGGYANFFCAGEYLQEALEDYFEECGILDLDSIARNNFNDWLRREGLLAIVGEKMLKEANAFLDNEAIDLLDIVDLRSDSLSLYLQNVKEVAEKLKETISRIDFKKAEYRCVGSNYTNLFAFKCLVKLLEE